MQPVVSWLFPSFRSQTIRASAFNKSGDDIMTGQTVSRRSSDLAGAVFRPLPGTEEEGRAIAKLLPNATMFVGSNATEGNLKKTLGPSVLHIATHGFFLSLTAAINGRFPVLWPTYMRVADIILKE